MNSDDLEDNPTVEFCRNDNESTNVCTLSPNITTPKINGQQ